MKHGGRVSGEDQSDHLWARQEGEGQGRWQKAFGNHAPMAPHTLARNLGGACRADPMRLQAPCPHTGSGPSRPRLFNERRNTVLCSPAWVCIGGCEGPSTGPGNCFPPPSPAKTLRPGGWPSQAPASQPGPACPGAAASWLPSGVMS